MTSPTNDGSRRVGTTDADVSRTRSVPSSDPTLIRSTTPQAETRTLPAKTSAAAVFALVFGLSALFCALTGLLAPAAVVLGIIGLVLAAVAFGKVKRPGVTGKGVAIGGLVTALLGLVLGGVVLAGAAFIVNNDSQLDRLQGYLDDARSNLPSSQDVRDSVPGQ